MTTEDLEIVGRQSSHYTRMVRMFASELSVPYRLPPIFELTSREPEVFAGNPALEFRSASPSSRDGHARSTSSSTSIRSRGP